MNLTSIHRHAHDHVAYRSLTKKKREIPTGKRCTSAVDLNGCCICNQRPISERAKFESLISRSDTSSLFQKDDSNLFPPSRYRHRTDCMYVCWFVSSIGTPSYVANCAQWRISLAESPSLFVTTSRRVRLIVSLQISQQHRLSTSG